MPEPHEPHEPGVGAVAVRQCTNPACLAEQGERHEAECTPDPMRSGGTWQDRRDWS